MEGTPVVKALRGTNAQGETNGISLRGTTLDWSPPWRGSGIYTDLGGLAMRLLSETDPEVAAGLVGEAMAVLRSRGWTLVTVEYSDGTAMATA